MKLLSIFRRRCPKCQRGPIFAGLLRMHPRCPDCGLDYFPEPGYYMGAIYFNYAMEIAIGAPVCIGLLMCGIRYWTCIAVTGVLLALFAPITFIYSRVLWLHFERRVSDR